MTGQLRACLLALVAINLVFVQITDAVSLSWLVPLFGLVLGAPILWPLQRYLVYQVSWNAALLAIFSLLVVDLRQSGARYMLEDGLILAAFCQVHILNNLAKQRRPDLVFFNSILIALVTGFFCRDLIYSVVFLLYALTLIIALRLASASTTRLLPTRVLGPSEFGPLVRRSLRQGGTVLVCTGLVFTFWPRNFEREGLVDSELAAVGPVSEIAFSEEIRFDRKSNAVKTNRVVMRAKLKKGSKEAVSSYWRGATFTNLQRYGWWADTKPQRYVSISNLQVDERWERVKKTEGEFYRPGYTTGAQMEIELTESPVTNLFTPLAVNKISFLCRAWPRIDGNFSVTGTERDKVTYTLDFNGTEDRSLVVGVPNSVHVRQPDLGDEMEIAVQALDQKISELLRPSSTQQQQVETIRRYLAGERRYLLPGAAGAVDSLAEFVAGEGGGHCEFFATTMVILLRKRDIPCRMVSGYLAHEWDESGTELTIRSNHAHAWVEVWNSQDGWHTVDPTPAQEEFARAGGSFLSGAWEFFRRIWTSVTGFDASARENSLAWAKQRLTDAGVFLERHPVGSALAILGLLLAHRWQKRRRGPVHPEVRDYLGALNRLGLQMQPGETPRQLLARARISESNASRIHDLVTATARHERERYGSGRF